MHSCSANTKCHESLADWATTLVQLQARADRDARFADIGFPDPTDCVKVGLQIAGGACNRKGLTGEGRFLVDALTSRDMLIDVDHVSSAARNEILTQVSASGYPVVSSHSGFLEINRGEKANESNPDPTQLRQILDGGGMVAPLLNQGTHQEVTHVSGAPVHGSHDFDRLPGADVLLSPKYRCDSGVIEWAQAFQYAVDHSSNPYQVAIGSDFNGFAGWPQGCLSHPVRYPVRVNGRSFDRSTLTVSPPRTTHTYDIARDGFAHIGMYPDFLAQLSAIGMNGAVERLQHSAEGYIRMWERADAAAVEEPQACIDRRAAIDTDSRAQRTVERELRVWKTEVDDKTSPHPGKPDAEQKREKQALTKRATRLRSALAEDVAAYATTEANVSDQYVRGQVGRVCMTQDPPPKSPPAPSTPTPAPTPKATPTPHGPVDKVCDRKPYLPQCQ